METKTRYSNGIVTSPHHDDIMAKYNAELVKMGKVNKLAFYRDHVEPVLPDVKYEIFRRYIANLTRDVTLGQTSQVIPVTEETKRLVKQLKKADEATRVGIGLALNIGADALQEIIDDPSKLTPKERADFLLKAMKAQDSRINAMARVRQDKREQITFEHVLGEAAYAEENE